MIITQVNSKRLQILNSIMILLIVIMHSIVPQNNYYNELISCMIFSNLTRIAVPLFFIMSSFFYFNNYSNAEYKSKTKKRFKSLVIPYFLTIVIYILLYGSIQLFSKFRLFFPPEYTLSDFDMIQWLRVFLLSTLNSPLWFIRDLFILYLFSPLIWVIASKKRIRTFVLIVLTLTWFIVKNCHYECVTFVYMGAYISSLKQTTIEGILSKLKNRKIYIIMIVSYFMLSIIRSLLLCDNIILLNDYISSILLSLLIFCGIVSIVNIVRLFENSWFGLLMLKLNRYSFFIYLFHFMVLHIYRNVLMIFIPIDYGLLIWVLVTVMTVYTLIAIYMLADNIYKPFLKVLVGGRA